MKRFKDKVAFVTGGSEGIGKEIAKALVTAGAHTVVFSRSSAKLRLALKEMTALRRTTYQQIAADVVDVTQQGQVEPVMAKALSLYGSPDYLINCAGCTRPGPMDTLHIRHFQKMMELNYFGVVHVCKAIVPCMATNARGHIVNTSFNVGDLGLSGYAGYCASKYAVIGLSEALRRELGPYNVRVSVLCPPRTRTPGLQKENEYKPADVVGTGPSSQTVDPEVVARETLKALGKKCFFILPACDGRIASSLRRFSPGVLHRAMPSVAPALSASSEEMTNVSSPVDGDLPRKGFYEHHACSCHGCRRIYRQPSG